MRNNFFILLFVLSIPSFAQKDQHFDNNSIAAMEAEQYNQLFTLEKTTVGNMYDLVYHRLVWDVDPGIKYISGSVTSYFFSKQSNLEELTFDLSDALTIDSVKSGNELLSFDSENDVLSITLTNALENETLDSLTIWYHGIPPATGFGSFIQSEHNGHPILWTLSEPYGAKEWWPCKQNLNDKIDSIDVIVTTPVPNRVASNGVLVSEITEGENKIFHWKHRHPIPAYLIAISVTNYEQYSEHIPVNENDSIEILNYVFPENLSQAQNQTEDLLPVFEFFNEKFMMYPYKDEKYGHAQFGWGGGMEHQTMSFVGSFNLSLLTHELAHQWFGDYITCGSWEDIWINEGFATYLTGMMYEEFFPDSWLDYKRDEINYITSEPDGSVLCDDTTQVWRIFNGRLSYAKGGMVLHMLRHELGDDLFFESLQNYLHDPELANGYAVTSQLQNHFEETADTILQEFFDDWYAGEGYPSYTVYWWQYENGSGKIAINQEQSHNSVDFFEMHLPVKFAGESQDTLITFHHLENGQEFDIDPGFTIENIAVDPEYNIIKGQSTVLQSTFLDIEQSFRLYPNPADDQLTIQSILYNKIDRVIVYDLSGKIIDSIQYEEASEIVSVNINKYPAGIHLLKIFSGPHYTLKKVIFKN